MKIIDAKKIEAAAGELAVKANTVLRPDVLEALKKALKDENNKRARAFLRAIIDNASCARRKKLAICQDTGMPVVFVEIGSDVHVQGDLIKAINRGIEKGYRSASFRDSIVMDPLKRAAPGYGPVIVHTDHVRGSKLKITVMPKGFGSENKSQLKMFKPTVGADEIIKFVVDSVKAAGPDACPPFVVGVGIGGTADYACLLAKKALLAPVNKDELSLTYKLEREILSAINKLNIGAMGLGGKTTALAVNIKTHPTHIAGLPVAVNISCHALRSALATL